MEQKLSQRKYIDIKQAKKTLANIALRKRRGVSKPSDVELERTTLATLKKWEGV